MTLTPTATAALGERGVVRGLERARGALAVVGHPPLEAAEARRVTEPVPVRGGLDEVPARAGPAA